MSTFGLEEHSIKLVRAVFKQLLSVAIMLGLLGGLVVVLWSPDREQYASIAQALFIVAVLFLSAILIRSIRHKQTYWADLLRTKASVCVGQALSISVFGALIAVFLYQGLILLVPYLFKMTDWPAFMEQMGVAFSATKLFVLVGITLVVTGLSIATLKS